MDDSAKESDNQPRAQPKRRQSKVSFSTGVFSFLFAKQSVLTPSFVVSFVQKPKSDYQKRINRALGRIRYNKIMGKGASQEDLDLVEAHREGQRLRSLEAQARAEQARIAADDRRDHRRNNQQLAKSTAATLKDGVLKTQQVAVDDNPPPMDPMRTQPAAVSNNLQPVELFPAVVDLTNDSSPEMDRKPPAVKTPEQGQVDPLPLESGKVETEEMAAFALLGLGSPPQPQPNKENNARTPTVARVQTPKTLPVARVSKPFTPSVSRVSTPKTLPPVARVSKPFSSPKPKLEKDFVVVSRADISSYKSYAVDACKRIGGLQNDNKSLKQENNSLKEENHSLKQKTQTLKSHAEGARNHIGGLAQENLFLKQQNQAHENLRLFVLDCIRKNKQGYLGFEAHQALALIANALTQGKTSDGNGPWAV